jgi:hypothetical protein
MLFDRVMTRAHRTIHSRTAHRHLRAHSPHPTPLLALAPQWQADEGPQQVAWPLSYKPCRHRAQAVRGHTHRWAAGDGHAVTQAAEDFEPLMTARQHSQAPAFVHMKSQDLRVQLLLLPPCLHLNSEHMLELPLASIPHSFFLGTCKRCSPEQPGPEPEPPCLLGAAARA